ncbi:MAG: FAD-binding protein [Saprospiraceae bacterium]|nr:FAD-binding protein [Saprospiraceae bacterium]
MIKTIEIKLPPEQAENEERIRQAVERQAARESGTLRDFRLVRRSLDARSKFPFFRLRIELYLDEPFKGEPVLLDQFQDVSAKPEVIIIGAGPAGYFAALELIELGLKPILFDRGKDVQARRRDLRAIQQEDLVNPNSNYCFGEGGAGTYSDGKLYTRSHKRGDIYKALRLLVEHGASSDILVDAHPHIGSNKLPQVVANIRQTILQFGGEIHFDSLLTDLIIEQGHIRGVVINEQEERLAKATILATGHSARDIYYLLNRKGIRLEAKPFALGVRIEHPQSLIDSIQYNQAPRAEGLPAASYRLACQVDGRGVFSFCMCPGGLVVPTATAPGEIVVNGMSLSRRDSPFANSGTVVAVEEADLAPFKAHGIFAGLKFQESVERAMFDFGTGGQQAPAQRLTDFVSGKVSADLNATSYIPGLLSADFKALLPTEIFIRLKQGVQVFGRKMKGYLTESANVIGTESRTSSPVRIPRDSSTYMHDGMSGLFPAGEGAGYAGGIISAAMDGQNVAGAVAQFYGLG